MYRFSQYRLWNFQLKLRRRNNGLCVPSDKGFTETGENKEVAYAYKVQFIDKPPFWNVRSFPQGTRNCYTLKPTLGKGSKYLVRARFLYGKYDNKGQDPTFDLYLGVNFWDTVIAQYPWIPIDKEILFVPSSDHFDVCLVNTGRGTPFISVLELRPSDNQTYVTTPGSGLQLGFRYNMNPGTIQEMRLATIS